MKVGFILLGCSKNLVGSEKMMGTTNSDSHELVHNTDEAEVITTNTYEFINSAKEEVTQTIFQMMEYKKYKCRRLIVAGYPVQRYKGQLEQDISETDVMISIREYPYLYEFLPKLLGGHDPISYDKYEQKAPSKPQMAYLKIAGGCSNHCTHCITPSTRGDSMSFPTEQLMEEAKWLAQRGVRELVVIAQDMTKYGVDLYGRRVLLDLLQQLHEIEGLHWIHILYMYPGEVDIRLIEGVTKLLKVLPYFDILVQHASNRMLQLMNRRGSREGVAALVREIRETFPYLTLCTTFIVRFPTEEEADSSEPIQFVGDIHWDCIGAFPYSPEKNTPARSIDGVVDEDVKEAHLA